MNGVQGSVFAEDLCLGSRVQYSTIGMMTMIVISLVRTAAFMRRHVCVTMLVRIAEMA